MSGWNDHESSTIKRSRYNPEDRTMEVHFNNGSYYTYHDVPQSTYDNFTGAESQGGFLHRYIKSAHTFTRS